MSNGEARLRTGALYWSCRAGVQLLARLFLRLTVTGAEHLPHEGGVLIVANHLSVADPPILAAISARPLSFMGKTELFRYRITSALFRRWRVFPVRRGEVDIGAVRFALGLLGSGEALVVFPEGTRRPKGLGEPLPGIGYLAARSGCPVVPVGIDGTEVIGSFWSLLRRPTVRIKFGERFLVPRGSAEMGADLIMRNIAALLPEARRGRYAGTEPLLPSTVGPLEEAPQFFGSADS